jgi:FkbM family methyltransferase
MRGQDMDEKKVKIDYAEADIWIHTDSHVEKESRAFSCKKEPETVEWIDTFFKRGDIVFDIGANIGAYSLIMSKRVEEPGRVFSFEPGWPNFYNLNRNIVLNNIHNIVPTYIALSSSKRIDNFNYQDFVTGSSLHTFGRAVNFIGQKFDPEYQQLIISSSIDEFLEDYQLNQINHVKIDVDGIEAEIINGAKKTLKRKELRSVLVEFNDAFEKDIQAIDYIKEAGFAIYKKIPNPSSYFSSDSVFNYIFTR